MDDMMKSMAEKQSWVVDAQAESSFGSKQEKKWPVSLMDIRPYLR
jgi:hypothetical protein